MRRSPQDCFLVRSSHCPDEKGTESEAMESNSFFNECSSHCPDEKGTESECADLRRIVFLCVAAIAPMKRGLKDNPKGDSK